MASYNDTYDYAINYTCINFNAGVPLAQIHDYLRSNGYPNLDVVTMGEWLRDNRRAATSHTVQATESSYPYAPPAAPAYHQTAGHQPTGSHYPNVPPAAPAYNQTAVQQPIHSRSRSSSRSGATLGFTPANRRIESISRGERRALEAHRAGWDIGSIRDQLSADGHDITLNDVIAILSRQGVNSFNVSKPFRQNRRK